MQARLPWLYLLLVAGINIFIVGEAFVTESTGHLHSMHGYWMAIADRAGLDRPHPPLVAVLGRRRPARIHLRPARTCLDGSGFESIRLLLGIGL